MQELISQLTSELGIDSNQAEGGLGTLAKLAKDNLGSTDLGELSSALPGLMGLISKAPETSGGLGGSLLGSALSSLGGESAGNLASLTQAFEKLGIDASLVVKFAPLVLSYLQNNGHNSAVSILKKLI